MSNLSDLIPAGGGQNNTDFVASGAIAAGKPVILNSAGTVTQVAESTSSDVIPAGSSASSSSGTYVDDLNNLAWDSGDTDKFMYVYESTNNNRSGEARVGTVSNSGGSTSISLGTTFTFMTGNTPNGSRCYILGLAADPNNAGKFLCVWADERDYPDYPFYAVVLNISGTNVTKGTEQLIGNDTAWAGGCGNLYFNQRQLVADPNVANQFIFISTRRDSPKRAYVQVVTVASGSGTTISSATPVEIGASSGSSQIQATVIAADPNTAGKFVAAYRDGNNSDYLYSQCITLSGTTATTGTSVVIASQTPVTPSIEFNSSVAGQFVVAHYGNLNGVYSARTIQGRVGVVTGTAISYAANAVGAGTATESVNPATIISVGSNKFMLSYCPTSGSSAQKIMQQVGTISSGAITWGTRVDCGVSEFIIASAADPNNAGRIVTSRTVGTGGPPDYSYVFCSEVGTTSTNMTSSTLLGISSAAISNAATGTINTWGSLVTDFPALSTPAAGTPVVFESADTRYISATFDSDSNKVVIAYSDYGNSYYGTAIVGTVSSTSISYGTPVVFESAYTRDSAATFDSNSNKVVIAYSDWGNGDHGTGIVGTVSGTAISFGSPVVFNAASTTYIATTFDSDSNKTVIAYQNYGNSNYGTAIVGTVSGTAISFGTAVVFEAAESHHISSAFDSDANKVVISYQDAGNSQYGTAIVGTVSGTAISFGTAVVYETAATENTSCAFDSNSNKVVIAYRDSPNSDSGTAIVGTVSGTAISFGTAVVYNSSGYTGYNSATFDSNANKVVISYRDQGNPGTPGLGYGTSRIGTVSDTSISFGTEVLVGSNDTNYISSTFDSNSNKVVIAYQDEANSDYGTGVVLDLAPPLTIASDYYAQADGTISTTSTSPAQLIGKAISATQINIKDYTG